MYDFGPHQTEPCHYGKAFYDMESGVEDIYIGLSDNSFLNDSVIPYFKVGDKPT